MTEAEKRGWAEGPGGTYINPKLPSVIRGLHRADPREWSVRNVLNLAADLVQELIDLRAEQGEWEYALAHRDASWDEGDVEEVVNLAQAHRFMAAWDEYQRADGVLLRRRPAGLWEPVTPEEEQ